MTLEIFMAIGAAGLVLFTGIIFIMAIVTRSELIELRHSNELAHKDYVYQTRERFEKVERDHLETEKDVRQMGYKIPHFEAQIKYLDEQVKKLDNSINGDCY